MLGNTLTVVVAVWFVTIRFGHGAVRHRNVISTNHPDLFAFTPAAGFVIGIALFLRFGLTEAEHRRIRTELDRRRRESEAS